MSVLSRRTYLKAEDRRAQILDVAKQVFASRGYHAANIADICESAGIGRGTLYQYFDNKRDVMLALMEDVATRVKGVLDRRPRVSSRPGATVSREAIVQFCRTRLRELLDAIFVDEATLRLILREARGLDGVVDEVIQRIDAMVLTAMEADTRASQEAGFTRRTDVRLTCLYILGGVEKMVLTALAQDEPVDLDAIVSTAIDLELFGLMPEEGRR